MRSYWFSFRAAPHKVRHVLFTSLNQSALWANSWIDRWLTWFFGLCLKLSGLGNFVVYCHIYEKKKKRQIIIGFFFTPHLFLATKVAISFVCYPPKTIKCTQKPKIEKKWASEWHSPHHTFNLLLRMRAIHELKGTKLFSFSLGRYVIYGRILCP